MPDQIATAKTVFKDLFSIFEIFAQIYLYWGSCVLPCQNENFFISKYLKDKSDENENKKTKRKGQEKKERK